MKISTDVVAVMSIEEPKYMVVSIEIVVVGVVVMVGTRWIN